MFCVVLVVGHSRGFSLRVQLMHLRSGWFRIGRTNPVGETALISHFAGCFTFEAMGRGPVQCEHGRYSAVFLVSHHVLVHGASYRCVICPQKPLVAGERRSENGACIVCSMN